MGRALFPHARSGRPRAVVCVPDLAAFEQVHELILIEEQFAKGLAQHWWTHVLSGMGSPEYRRNASTGPEWVARASVRL